MICRYHWLWSDIIEHVTPAILNPCMPFSCLQCNRQFWFLIAALEKPLLRSNRVHARIWLWAVAYSATATCVSACLCKSECNINHKRSESNKGVIKKQLEDLMMFAAGCLNLLLWLVRHQIILWENRDMLKKQTRKTETWLMKRGSINIKNYFERNSISDLSHKNFDSSIELRQCGSHGSIGHMNSGNDSHVIQAAVPLNVNPWIPIRCYWVLVWPVHRRPAPPIQFHRVILLTNQPTS